MKPANWPRYMLAKRLKDGRTAYYWSAQQRDLKAGCSLRREALGLDYGNAIAKADLLNKHLDAWREGRGAPKELDLKPDFGTLRWLVERYKRSRAWEKVSPRSRGDYERAFRLVLDHPTKIGCELGRLPASSVTARAADKLYVSLQKSRRVERRLRTANLAMICMARAWDVVQRLYPQIVPQQNPFRGIEMDYGKGTTRPATREEAYSLHAALVEDGCHVLREGWRLAVSRGRSRRQREQQGEGECSHGPSLPY